MRTQHYVVPDHVPADRVVDFDFFDLDGADVHRSWAVLHQGPDIIWTPHNGGHWIATRADDIDAMQSDHVHFSHNQFNLPPNPRDIDLIPVALDPPDHGKFRSLIVPAMMPKAVKGLEEIARQTARTLLDQLAPRGQCEFIADFAKMLPINIFLHMVDLPQDDRAMLLEWAEIGPRSDDLEEKKAASKKLGKYIATFISERTASPGTDLISQITQSEVDGRPISAKEALNICVLLLFGGLDTVASQMGFIAKFLAENPGHRHRLLAEPRITPTAIEEMLRRFALPNTARILTCDYHYKDVHFRKGDMIQLPKSLYALDERRNSDPFTVDFDRRPSTIKHVAFGGGVHVCPGAVLARREIAVFLEEWLPRIPDFTIDPDRPPTVVSGMTNSFVDLHLRWVPTERH
jgi:cytochrome P450